jgi:allantoicase
MKLETLFEANKVAKELERWNDIATRLECGNGFYRMSFKAEKNKTMFTDFEYSITDDKTIACFKKFVDEQIKKCQDEIERM